MKTAKQRNSETAKKRIKRIVEEENDGRMKYVRMPADNGGGYDHPGTKGHAEFARILIEEMEKYFEN